ncbi:unnamed protein product [Gongylonema pulchrum]|uniref:UBX domain-containing protein n=1 Tax=Gongylonema pulchrum TaxID=637853 RepID=A0A183EE11_9BILA|nr:unnamed protein product [Gongylonema pulchrum]
MLRVMIKMVQWDENGNTQVTLRFCPQGMKAQEHMQKYTDMAVQPNVAYTGFEFRNKQFKNRVDESRLRLLGMEPEHSVTHQYPQVSAQTAVVLTKEQER